MDDQLSSWAPFADEEYVENEPYRYTPISSQDEIRCLILEPGQTEDPIFCNIKTFKLAEEPIYEAISYTWGEPLFRSKIICDGRQMFITRTLCDSLRQCRSPNEQRVLWADSICINQGDKHEKSHQVRLMTEIYSQAAQVLICLGLDDDGHAERAFSFIRNVNRMIEDQFPLCQGSGSFPACSSTDPLPNDTRWASFSAFSKEPWFNRGWVIQEAALPVKAQVLYGTIKCDWLHFLRANTWATMRCWSTHVRYGARDLSIHSESYKSRYESEAANFYSARTIRQLSLLEILDYARAFQFTDSRDRIYAFIGLPIAKDYRSSLEISYEKSMLETYRSFACLCIDKFRDPQLLQFVEHDPHTLSSSCPSWVPQWQTNIYRLHITKSWFMPILPARMPMPTPMVESSEGGIESLLLKGIVTDVIVFVSSPFKENCPVADVVKVWRQFQEYEHQHGLSVYTTFLPVLAFLATLVCGTNLGGFDEEEEATLESLYIQRLKDGQPPIEQASRNPSDPASSTSPTEDELLEVVQSGINEYLQHRKVAITQRGYYCLIPDVAEQGDICCILYGTTTPFVLRKSAVEGLYHLLGEAYIVSSYDFKREESLYPLRIGVGHESHPDWLDLDLEEQDIVLV